MKVKSKVPEFDLMLQEICGRFYGKEMSTFTKEELRELQSKIDKSKNMMPVYVTFSEEYSALKSCANRNLQSRGG